ncbi:uncharacterized protein B0I36DRAFT_314791 [Microdochium trichocladiopsis]|uniref:Uncharacterized protein n=1 Tax=Microdochium trichocladiopsis TaxID=1682393 RepID=A0A9P8YF51_9PEZI|nr:uncharacterized protein B0I36DRAFT_314791 [Microdochium trichocladiopsis]KAH7037777.1 hypothetical protein B0I36DRAFT_314791 [Microdochium trichocladiopsis]
MATALLICIQPRARGTLARLKYLPLSRSGSCEAGDNSRARQSCSAILNLERANFMSQLVPPLLTRHVMTLPFMGPESYLGKSQKLKYNKHTICVSVCASPPHIYGSLWLGRHSYSLVRS